MSMLQKSWKYISEAVVIGKESLKSSYEEFSKMYGKQESDGKYSGLLGQYLRSNPNLDDIKARLIRYLAEFQKKDNFKITNSVHRRIPTIVAYVFAIWTLQKVK